MLDDGLLFNEGKLTLHRLAQTRHANLSGVGAALYPGRWNRVGQEALYTSINRSLPVLEKLVHTTKTTIPKNLSMMTISVRGNWEISHRTAKALSRRWVNRDFGVVIDVRRTLTEATEKFQSEPISESVLAIAVPSVIVPEWNVVLFPAVRAYSDLVSLDAIEPFEFDPRLFPETSAA